MLEDNNVSFEVVEYLKNPLNAEQLQGLIRELGLNSAHDLMRTKETVYKEKDIASLKGDENSLIKAIVENPVLMERPVYSVNGKAAIGRPPENVLEIV